MKWEKLKADELALMRNGSLADTFGASGGDAIQERRRGGLCDRVEEFGGVIDQAELKRWHGIGEMIDNEEGGALGLIRPMGGVKVGETF
jgi:hypothetical protein